MSPDAVLWSDDDVVLPSSSAQVANKVNLRLTASDGGAPSPDGSFKSLPGSLFGGKGIPLPDFGEGAIAALSSDGGLQPGSSQEKPGEARS